MNQDWNNIVFHKKTSVKEKKDKKDHDVYIKSNEYKKIEDDNYVLSSLTLEMRNKIIQGRQAKNLTQKQLAIKINVQQNVVSDYESGKCVPDKKILRKIENTLNIKF